MAFPRRLLTEGEELILDLRPHWIALVFPAFMGIAVAVLWVLVLPRIPFTGGPHSILVWTAVAAGVVVLFVFTIRPGAGWVTSHFVVTSDRVIHREGIIGKHSMEIPLEAINDVRLHQGLLERMVGAGDLILESASERGREVFRSVPNPESVQKTMYDAGERNQQRMVTPAPPESPSPSAAAGPAAPASVAEEVKKLDALRDEGVLTEVEFQTQKRKLLGP